MRAFLLLLTLASTLPAAGAATPSLPGGTWQLTNVQGFGAGRVAPGTSFLVITGGTVRGRFGCGAFAGSAEVTGQRVRLAVRPLAPAPGERCPFGVPQAVLDALNGSERYVASEAQGRLVLLSGTTRLTFERPGSPARPR